MTPYTEGTLAYARSCTRQALTALQIATAVPGTLRADEVEKAKHCLEDALRAHANAVHLEQMAEDMEAAE